MTPSRMTPSRKLILPTLLMLALAAPALRADAPRAEKMDEWELLRESYKTLSVAKKDYGGHRRKAMDAIEAACDKLNHEVRGEGKGHESREVSDDELKAARHQLDEARAIVDSHHQPAVTKNIEEAIAQVDMALDKR